MYIHIDLKGIVASSTYSDRDSKPASTILQQWKYFTRLDENCILTNSPTYPNLKEIFKIKKNGKNLPLLVIF